MFKRSNLLFVCCMSLIALFCFVGLADAAGGCKDRDNDGYFNKAGCGSEIDCDDNDAAVNPVAVEECTDGIDNDCDGLVDIQDPDAVNCPICTDNDGDGYNIEGGGCGAVDCNDADPAINPGAAEICTGGVDEDCDDLIDDNDPDCQAPGCTDYTNRNECNNDPGCEWVGSRKNGSCQDTCSITEDPEVTCDDGIDNDCDGNADTADSDCLTCNDNDGDGYNTEGGGCGPVDCNDNDPAVNPGATEGPNGDPTCSDTVDNDCDGLIDTAQDPGCAPVDCSQFTKSKACRANSECEWLDGMCIPVVVCTDNDGDGYNIEGGACGAVDCNDTDPSINPGASDANCNGVDENCDTIPDDGYVITGTSCGVGECSASGQLECQGGSEVDTCTPLPAGTEGPEGDPTCTDTLDNDCDDLIDAGDPGCEIPCIDNDNDGFGAPASPYCTYNIEDCDDTDPTINPFGTDLCDGIDRDCNGTTINDDDADGFGVPASPYCTYNIEDCDDTDPTINPFGTDLCDGIDRDCNGTTINDDDADGFGVPASPYCTYNIEDCDDTDPTINPFGTDLCDGIDRDCNGTTINDDDADGFGVPASPYCTYNIEDCNDTDPTINPFGTDLCDGIDRDCNGTTINDDDADGFGVPASPYCTYNIEDCNDTDPTINPFGTDLCDGIDRDCNGTTINDDDADGFGVPASPYCTYNIEDCDDTDPLVNPLALEGPFGDPTCSDTKDNNCDDLIDASDPGCENPCIDNDADGYSPVGGSCGPIDCDDNNPNRSPGEQEGPFGSSTCVDGFDNDCDELIDLADQDCANTCTDLDGDGYGNPGDPTCPNGTALDCNDNDPTINPGVDDSDCNGVDDDCSGTADDGYVVTPTFCGVGECAGNTGQLECQTGSEVDTCDPFAGAAADDSVCNGLDDDCDGPIDEDYVTSTTNCGVGVCSSTGLLECQSGSEVDSCSPGSPTEDPEATCTDGLDNDCDGLTDTAEDPDCEIAPPPPHDMALCEYCHISPTDFTTPIPDSKCDQCHTPGGSLKGSFPTAPDVLGHTDSNGSGTYTYTNNCIDCHNPMFAQVNLKYIRSTISGSVVPATITFIAYTGPGSFADGPPHQENLCETCHSLTSVHRYDGSTPPHNDGFDCTTCHAHDNAFIPAGGSGCTDCHNGIPGGGAGYVTRDVVGIDYTQPSRHVFGGTVTSWDCIVCHREGDASQAAAGTVANTALHQNSQVEMRNVDSINSGGVWDKNNTSDAMYTELDNFCMGCHDPDGASGINVKATDDGVNLDATRALTPFNSSDGLSSTDTQGGTVWQAAYERIRVNDVFTKFDPSNPSHHAVRGQAYSSHDADWGSTAWVDITLKSGQSLVSSGLYEAATLHCTDCHAENSHGGPNGFRLQASSIDGTCYLCHAQGAYLDNTANSTDTRWDHSNDGSAMDPADGAKLGQYGGTEGSVCLNCHGGDPATDGFGGIHGLQSGTDSRSGEERYRFQGGSYMSHQPGSWTLAGGSSTCYFAGSSNQDWSNCSQHNGTNTNRTGPMAFDRGVPGDY